MARVAFALLLLSCAPARRSWQPVQTPQAVSYAVIWQGAPLHVAPSPSAPAVRLMSDRASQQPWGRTALSPFRVLWERDGWIALETLGEPDASHCAPAPPALRPMRLKLFVPTAALVPVTTREIHQEFPDGTELHLARGVPLEPLGSRDLYRARMGELTTVVRLSPGEVGTRYQPSEPLAPLPIELMLGGDALAAGVPTLAGSGRVHADHAVALPAAMVDMQGGSESRVEIRPRCGRLVVRVPFQAVGPPSGLVLGSFRGGASGDTWIEAGAPITWGSGDEAGVASERVFVTREVEGGAGTRCFAHALRYVPENEAAPDPSAFITVCARERDVVDPSVPPSRRLDDPAGDGNG